MAVLLLRRVCRKASRVVDELKIKMSQQKDSKVEISEERIKELVELLDGVNNDIIESV